MSPIRHILFDLDGTLIDSAPGILDTFSQILAARSLVPRVALDQRLIGPPLVDTLRMLTGIERGDPLLDRLGVEFKACYDASICLNAPPYPGVPEMLERLRAHGIVLHIATSKRIVPTRRIVEHMGWSTAFASVNTGDSYAPALKNKAELIGQVIREQHVDVNEAVYVGDTREDGQSAAENGMAFWAAFWGYGQLADHDPSGFAGSLARAGDLWAAVAART